MRPGVKGNGPPAAPKSWGETVAVPRFGRMDGMDRITQTANALSAPDPAVLDRQSCPFCS